VRYPLDQLLTMHRLARERGAIVHCALVDVGGACVICAGVSGAGKTTLSRQLVGHPDLRVLSDDRAVIRRSGDGYGAYGTPWPGEGGFAVNAGLPLVGVGFIEKRPAPETSALTRTEAIRRLVRVTSVPWYDREGAGAVFDGLADLCGRVPTWRLCVPPDASAVEAVRALAAGRPLPV
jgi:serine kinase of HPr protein (carbohydrate metabolism regulator)